MDFQKSVGTLKTNSLPFEMGSNSGFVSEKRTLFTRGCFRSNLAFYFHYFVDISILFLKQSW